MSVQLQRRLFTVREYHQMALSGILFEDDRVELIEGEIIKMTPIGTRHIACVNRLNKFFSDHIESLVIVSVQNPIRLDEHSEPQPDLALLRYRPDFYAQAHPEPEDVLLVVEVAETSVDFDRQKKVPLYAITGIPEVWLVNLSEEYIEVYLKPSLHGYGEVQRFMRGQKISPQAFMDIEMRVDEMLG